MHCFHYTTKFNINPMLKFMPWIKYNFLFDSRVAAGGGSMMDQLFILLKLYSKRHIHQRSFYFIRLHVTYPTSLKGCYKEIPHFKPNLTILVAVVTGWKQLKRSKLALKRGQLFENKRAFHWQWWFWMFDITIKYGSIGLWNQEKSLNIVLNVGW